MGNYLNFGNKGFQQVLQSEIYVDKTGMIEFLQSAESAIAQIKERQYDSMIKEKYENLLLVGISYDRKTKEHECRIEKYAR